jgi:predicted RNA binding protein YcfA (HicA-like mRNA interferase family)
VNSYRCRHVIVVNVRGSHFRFRSSSTALVVAHRCRSIRVRLQPSSVLQSSDRRRNTNSYRCRHVIVVKVSGSHFRFRSSSTALVVAHCCRSIRVRLQPSSVLQSSDRRREQLPLSTRHCRQGEWKSFPFPVVVDSIGRRSLLPFHTGAAPAIVSATVERSTA